MNHSILQDALSAQKAYYRHLGNWYQKHCSIRIFRCRLPQNSLYFKHYRSIELIKH